MLAQELGWRLANGLADDCDNAVGHELGAVGAKNELLRDEWGPFTNWVLTQDGIFSPMQDCWMDADGEFGGGQ